MTQHSKHFSLSVCALAASLLLAACGGAESTDTVAPTVVITDSVAGETAAGPVTFTFTFSEDVGTSFAAEDITVTGGTAGALTKVDAMTYTQLVTPAANSTGTINVSVGAAKFKDLALNDNVASASAEQAYVAGDAGSVLVSFDEATPAISGMGAYGGAVPTVEAGPAEASGNALKIVKPTGAKDDAGNPVNWGGTYFTVAAIPFTADRKVLSARVYSTKANAVIKLKVEIPKVGSVEVAGTTTGPANTWSTVTWDLAAVDPSKNYTVIAITPDAEAVPSGQSYYIDTLTLDAAAAPVTPPAPGSAFVSFDEDPPAFSGMGAYGGALPTVEAGPEGSTGNALKIIKPTGAKTDAGELVNWGGTFFTTSTIPFTSTDKTITARVYSTRANAVIKFKVEVPGGDFVEVASAPTGPANTWSTVSWDFSAVNPTQTYKIMAITPDAETVPSDQTYYFDDIKVTSAGVVPGALSYIAQPFIENVQSAYDTTNSKARTGNYETGFYSAPGMTWWWGGPFKSKIQSGYGVSKTDVNQSYFGMYIKNGGAGWDIAAATKYVFSLGTNGECAGKCAANVRLVSAASASCVADVKVPLTAAAVTAYSRNLAEFTVSGCTTNTMEAFKQAKVAELHFQMLRADMQFTNTADTGGLYPNGLDMGDSIGFDAPTGAPATAADPVVSGPAFSQMTFDDSAVTYKASHFGGAISSILDGPVGGSGKAVKVIKAAGAATWAGVTLSTGANDSVDKIPFTATAKTLTVKVWAPAAGIAMRMKVEDATDVTHNCETDTVTTTANGWQTLTFDFNTRAYNNGDPTQLTSNRCVDNSLLLVSTLNKVSVFPAVGTEGAGSGDFYFDDVKFVP